MELIELCAGSAAVSMRWLNASHKPPFGYLGAKLGYADQILAQMGLRCGDATSADRVVLVEPGPWGEAWETWRQPHLLAQCVTWLRDRSDVDPRELWRQLASAPVPTDLVERVCAWSALMFWSFGSKPIHTQGMRWKHHGFDPRSPYRREIALAKRAAGIKYEIGNSRRLPYLIERLEALHLSKVEVFRSIDEVEPRAGALVYIDPPYVGVTTGYSHRLDRAAVIQTAQRWADVGSLCLVSEAEPLPIPGWSSVELRRPKGRGRTFSKQQREFLTISPHDCADAAGVPGHDASAHHADHGLHEHEQPAAGLSAQRAEG